LSFVHQVFVSRVDENAEVSASRMQVAPRNERPFRTERSRSSRPVRGSDERWMKIATFNINNVKRRLPNLLDWLNAGKPDVVCLQELMCSEHDFPAAPIKEAGYSAGLARRKKTWNAPRSWSDTANPF
jgi:Endonuclease/Exonuclease/phosphatase family